MDNTVDISTSVSQAVRLFRNEQRDASHAELQGILKQKDYLNALLWLAKVTTDPGEARAAAELAMHLAPENEVAQRAYVQTHQASPGSETAEVNPTLAMLAVTGMTLRQARAVLWPFRGVYRPMGEVLDDGTIGVRDLAWAAENAYDERIRNAATALLFARLLKVGKTASISPLVISKDRYVERRERMALLLTGTGIGLYIGVMVLVIVAVIGTIVFRWEMPLWASVCALLTLFLIERVGTYFANRSLQYRQGRRAEEQAVDVLRQVLIGEWTIYRNVSIPNFISGDLDMVLVGPGGIWAIEVKSYSGEYTVQGKQWRKKGRRGWYTLKKDPGMQVRRVATELQQYLKSKGISVPWVQPVVLWSNGNEGIVNTENPYTPVWNVDDLIDQVDALYQQRTLPDDVIEQVKAVLA